MQKSRNMTLKPGLRWVEVVVVVPIKQLTVGTHSLMVKVDPENKVDEASESNSMRLTLKVEAPPPDDEWVACPAVGVSALVEATFDGGKVHCVYRNTNRPSEVMSATVVESQYLKPWRYCLRDNSAHGKAGAKNGGNYTSRMYCSFVKSSKELVEGATGWESASSTRQRVHFGFRKSGESDEDFEICRVRYDGSLRVGRGWRGRCYIPYKNAEQRIDSGIEYLVLTQAYGVPTRESNQITQTRDIQPSLDPRLPDGLRLRFCQIGPMFPNDVAAHLGLTKDLMLAVPGTLLIGDFCVSSAQGAAVTIKSSQPGFAVMVLR
jgi:hypothetical protein